MFFSVFYPVFVFVITIIVRKTYINTCQGLITEEFANKLVLYNRYLITAIYILSLIGGLFVFEIMPGTFLGPGVYWIVLFMPILILVGLCFLFYLFILPIFIRLILLKKVGPIFEIIILGIFSLFTLFSLNIIKGWLY